MTSDECPLCGTSVALLRRPEQRSETERRGARVLTLGERAEEVARGDLTPRRIHEQVRALERRGRKPQTRAS